MTPRPKRSPYPSDVTDAQWRRIEPLIPPERGRGRHRSTDLREVVSAIHYRWATNCVWRRIPKGFPPWATVYTYYRDWDRCGALAAIRAVLAAPPPPADDSSDAALDEPLAEEAEESLDDEPVEALAAGC